MEKEKLWSTPFEPQENNFKFVAEWIISKAFTVYVMETIMRCHCVKKEFKINLNFVKSINVTLKLCMKMEVER